MICHRYDIRRFNVDSPEEDSIPKWSDQLTEDEVTSQMERFRRSDEYFSYYIEPTPVGNIKRKDMQVLFLEHCLSIKDI